VKYEQNFILSNIAVKIFSPVFPQHRTPNTMRRQQHNEETTTQWRDNNTMKRQQHNEETTTNAIISLIAQLWDFIYRKSFTLHETLCILSHMRVFKKRSLFTSCAFALCNVKWPRYRPGVAQRLGRGIALLFHGRGTRRGWVVSSTTRPHFTPGDRPGRCSLHVKNQSRYRPGLALRVPGI